MHEQGNAMRRFALSVLASAAILASARSAAAEQPIGHWTFDRLDGQNAPDSTDNRPPAAVHGATPVAGIQGGALAFDGLDDYVPLGDLGQFDAVTVAFWMKGQDIGKADDWQGLVTSDGWEEGVFHIGARGGKISAILNLGENDRSQIVSRPLKNGTWYHVAVVADCRGRTIRLFLNGCEEDEDSISSPSASIKLVRQVVGREFDGKESSRHFRGAIDDVRIYDRVLDELDIQGLCPGLQPLSARDTRNIRAGSRIPDEGYCDQPYVVITADGNWLCTLTTSGGHEGAANSHIIATISADRGRTWSEPVSLEPVDGPPSVYSLPVVARNGRVYVFYNYNGDNFECPGRDDCVGWLVFKYSDDNGRTWSKDRYRLPMRMTEVDRTNTFGAKVQIFWGIGKPIAFDNTMVFAFSKCGTYVIDRSEGWFYRSDNILTEPDVSKIEWQLLPDGDVGLKNPDFGVVQAEQNIVPMSDGSIYCMYRTTLGYPCHAYSRDGAHTWTMPEFATYTPGGKRMKNPRACPRIWRCQNGKFLFWFHNHGGKSFKGRNPVWISGGLERNGKLHWSQPEILLYDPDVTKGMSYPDLIEQDGRYWVTETQKTVARVHELDKTLLEETWNQGNNKTVAREGLILDLDAEQLQPGEVKLPSGLDLAETGGAAWDFWITLDDLAAGQVIVDSRDADGRGMALTTTDQGTIRIDLDDGRTKAAWDCDPGLLKPGQLHHVAVIVDAGPKIITFVVDGVLCDGGEARPCGWGRCQGELADVSGSGKLRVSPSLGGDLKGLRIYRRYLRTSEAVANYHAGP